MACNCCKTGSCSCKMLNFDPNAEVPSFTIYPFSYNFNYKMSPWIHREYPEPIFMATWDRQFGAYLASNHVKKNGQVRYYGDISYYSRKGVPAGSYINAYGGYYIPDGNGDNSEIYRTGGNVQAEGATVFALEEKQDNVKRECQLWAKFKRITPILDNNGGFIGYEQGPWGELELLHSMKWDEPFQSQLIVTISGDHFNGPTSVELRYHCIDACSIFSNRNDGGAPNTTWIINGQADWITESTVEFPLDYCKSYGTYDGNITFDYTDCGQAGLVRTTTNNRAKKVLFYAYTSCGYQYGFSCNFFGYSGGFCEEVLQPCNIPYNDPYYCCGNVYGGYTTQPDGTESCGLIAQIPIWSMYGDDIHNRDLIDSKTVRFNGIFHNSPIEYVQTYNCSTRIQDVDPSAIYKAGTILATGV